MKATLVSFFNSSNIGDQMIGDHLEHMLKPYFSEIVTVSYSGSLKVHEYKNHNENERARVSRRLYNRFLKSINISAALKIYRKYFRKEDLSYFENIISTSDFLIIGGGNMIFDLDVNSSSSYRFNRFIDIARHHNKKIFAISLGIGPFKTKRQVREAVEALSKCDYITFRDYSSMKIFQSINKNHPNVNVAVDPVFMQDNSEVLRSLKGNFEKIGINIINSRLFDDKEIAYENSIKGYTKLIEKLLKGTKSELYLFSTEDADYKAVEDVYNNFLEHQRVTLVEIKSASSLLSFYSEIDFLFGTRMHAMIVGFTQCLPMIGISWQEKVDAMFRLIEHEEYLVEFDLLRFKIEDIMSMFNEIQNERENYFEKNITVIERLRKRNDVNISYINNLKVNDHCKERV